MKGGLEKELMKRISTPSVDMGRPVVVTNTPEYLVNLVSDSFSFRSGIQVRARVYRDIEDVGVLRSGEVALSVGSSLKFSDISSLGYRKTERVWEEGEYSVLGDVIIVWQAGSRSPVRISLWGDKVESIDIIDKDTRLTTKSIKSIALGTGKIESVKMVRSYTSNFGEDLSKSLELIFVQSPFDAQEYSSIYTVVDLGLRTIPGLQVYTDKDQLRNLLRLYSQQNYRVVAIVEDKADLPDRIKTDEIIPKTLATPSRGFVDTSDLCVYLTETELFGQVDLNIVSEKAYEDIFKKLTPGDYVVHQDHGIGVFESVVEQSGHLYIELQYASKDRLLIPFEQSEKIDKYVGAGRGKPVLTGLGGNAWKSIRKKVRVDAIRIAKELIRLYAMRNVVKTEGLVDLSVKEEVLKFSSEFAYEDTEDQRVITNQLLDDMALDRPMDRLIVGDVGFGKTELAIRAAYAAVLAGKQVAFLAPTTILVEQHLAVINGRLSKHGVVSQSLSRLKSGKQKDALIEEISAGRVDIVVGTHALLSDAIHFKDLGLLIIDEEQKFGVKQKEKLKEKRLNVHVLSLTATPIPRTLNMALNRIKDMSVLASVPAGRKPIKNFFEKFSWEGVGIAIEKEIARGGQVYFLHNRVRDIDTVLAKLRKILPDISVEMIHGQMSASHISSAMRNFSSGRASVLLTTTIIENGMDLPNVNTLIVEGSENFGLSQLYQIRGRIGRLEKQAFAYFMHGSFGGLAAERLAALKEADYLGSGFILSNRDLEIRGVGDILGSAQSGAINSVGYAMYSKILNEEVGRIKESESNAPYRP